MTPRRLVVIAVLAVIAVGGALWIAGQRSLERAPPSEALYPDLRAQLEEVERIRVYGPGDQVVVTIDRGESGWRVLERGGYAADTSKLRALLRGLAEARLVEEKTSQPANYSALGVEDPSVPGATGVRVVLDGATPPVDLIVGSQAPARGGSYVRRHDEATSWLADRAFDIPKEPRAWIDRSVIDVGADRIQSASIERAGARYDAAKSSRTAADFTVTGLPPDRTMSSASAANSIATALVRLEADDVKPESEFDEVEPEAAASFQTFDGLVLDLRGYALDGEKYLTLDARTDPELARRFELPVATDAEPSPAEAAQDDASGNRDREVSEEVQRIESRVRGWAYAVPEYKYDAIFRPAEALLAPVSD
jgi:hypothetical protein